jgi:hypothetical protein
VGSDHLDTAETMVHLAELAVVLGCYRRADTLARAALLIRQEKLESSNLLVGNTLGLVGRNRSRRLKAANIACSTQKVYARRSMLLSANQLVGWQPTETGLARSAVGGAPAEALPAGWALRSTW